MMLRDAIGLGALLLIVLGVWGLAGWPAAAITAGLPVGGFYLWGEIRAARAPRISDGGME